MRAVVLREFGGPERLRYEEVPTSIPGPGEVLVQVQAVSVNRTLDLKVRQDGGGYGVVLPLVLGVDPSGVVVAVGEGTAQSQRGARVAIIPMGGEPIVRQDHPGSDPEVSPLARLTFAVRVT